MVSLSNLLFLLHEELEQFAGANHLGLFPSVGKMTLVTGDQIIRIASLGAFKEHVVVRVGTLLDLNARLHPMAQLSNRLERAFDNIRRSLQVWAANHFVIFGKDGIGYAELHFPGKSEHQHGSRKALRLEKRGDKNVGVDNDPNHWPGFCLRRSRRAAAISASISFIVSLSRQCRFALSHDFSSQSGGGAKVFT